MKKMLKRSLAAVLVLVLMLSVCACSTKKGEVESDVPVLTWYVPGDAQKDLPRVLEEANKIVEPAIGAKIDIKFIDQSSYAERIQMMMASRTEFDMMLTGYVNKFPDAIQKGGLMPITDIVKEHAPKIYKALPEYAWQASSSNGEIYAIPNQQIWARSMAFALRKDLVEKYNFDTSKVKTIEDVEEFWKLVQKNDPEIIPIYLSMSEDPNTVNKYETISSDIVLNRETNQLEIAPMGKNYETLANTRREWYKKGYLRKDIATAVNQEADLRAGRFASWFVVYKPGVELEKQLATGHEWIMIPFMKPYVMKHAINATMTGVSSTSKHPVESVKFIELINDNVELYRLIAHGIEGVHYEKISDNVIRFIEGSGYKPNADWKFGNQFNAYVVEGKQEDVWEQTKKMNDEAEISPLIGFSFVPTNVATEITQVSTVKNNFTFDAGTMDVNENLEKYRQQLKQAGIENVLAEIQKQVDEYNKSVK